MRILANNNIRKLFIGVTAAGAGSAVIIQLIFYFAPRTAQGAALAVSALSLAVVLLMLRAYFRKQDRKLEEAVSVIGRFLSGNMDARIESDEEGEMYRLFHSVNALSQALYVRASKEKNEKTFLKDTISDISHQLKTPLAALSIYNGLMQEEAESGSQMSEFLALSEKELDRIETLVQNLLKITKLDAGTLAFSKETESVADMMRDIELRFSFRAKREGKRIELSGSDGVYLYCDRGWMTEAVENLVKNALDHTSEGDIVTISWSRNGSLVKIQVSDTGSGIDPEDIYHIFKRFYRSRHSKDKQGAGLGLPIAKAIAEGHGGTIEAESELGKGSTFSMIFLTREAERQD